MLSVRRNRRVGGAVAKGRGAGETAAVFGNIVRRPGDDYQIHVVGAGRPTWRDFYHAVLRWPWSVTLATIAAVYLGANALFALGYLWTDGVTNMPPGSFKEAFFFSVQTMGTIGYGAMFPRSDAANGMVVAESLTGLLLTALTTGLVFAKFSRSTARFVFTREAVIGPMNGQPTLSFRLGNARANQIVNAEIHISLVRTEQDHGRTDLLSHGRTLPISRDRALTFRGRGRCCTRSTSAAPCGARPRPRWRQRKRSYR